MDGKCMETDGPDADFFLALETSLHRPEVRSSSALVESLLAEGFLEFGKSGRVYDKQTMLAALAEEALSPVDAMPQVIDFRVAALSSETVLITYRSIRASCGAWKRRETLRSSIWKFGGKRWEMVFHQGTPVPQE